VREIGGERSEVWRCQATEAFNASTPLKTSNLPQYWRELTNGNFGLLRFIGLSARGFMMEIVAVSAYSGRSRCEAREASPQR